MTGKAGVGAVSFAQDPDGTWPGITGTGLPEAISPLLPATDGRYSIAHVPGAPEARVRWWGDSGMPGYAARRNAALTAAGDALAGAGWAAYRRSGGTAKAVHLVVTAPGAARPCWMAYAAASGPRCRKPPEFEVIQAGISRASCRDHLSEVGRRLCRESGAPEFTVRFTEDPG